MVTLSSAKILGGIGSLLVVLGMVLSIWTAGFVVAIVGLILVVVAVKYIAELVSDNSIFRNMIISIATVVVGLMIFFGIILATAVNLYLLILQIPSSVEDPMYWLGLIIPYLVPILVGVIILVIAAIFSAVYLRKSLDRVADRLGVGLFRTAALLYLIGAVLLIVIVGALVIWVAWILLVFAFFTLPDSLPQVGSPATPPQPVRPPPPTSI